MCGRVSKDTAFGPKDTAFDPKVKGRWSKVKGSVHAHTHIHTYRVCHGVGVGWEVRQSEGG